MVHFLPGELITKEESPRGQSITVDPEKGAQTNQAHPPPTAIINHPTHKPQRTTHQTKFARGITQNKNGLA
jgi:hypothetical protein